jgi:hypothetical protein
MEEPVEVQLAASKYTLAIRGAGWCGTRSPPRPLNLAAIAILPPLMLVNHESHAIASTYYKRAFRGVGGAGGVLAAYPTVLRADRYPDSHDAIDLLHPNELGLVQVFALKLEGLMVERVMHQVWKVLEAPNLKRIVVETKDWWKLGPPRTCVALREFVEPKLSVSDPNVPEVELIIKNSNEGSLEGAYYFRGSIFDLPSSYEIL